MKLIPLKNDETFKSIDVIKAVASQPSGSQGINAEDMRRRVRILDALDATDGDRALLLEDADHILLCGLINKFQFATASRELLAIIDDVMNAKAPSADGQAPGETAAAAA